MWFDMRDHCIWTVLGLSSGMVWHVVARSSRPPSSNRETLPSQPHLTGPFSLRSTRGSFIHPKLNQYLRR